MLQFGVLGSLEIRRGEVPLALASRRQRTLLAALLVHAGRVVSVDALTEVLWGDEPPVDPRNAVQTYVARLRDVLGKDAPLVTRRPGYALDVAPHQVDALRFEQLLTEAQRRSDQPSVVRELLEEGLGLWRGPAYAEFADSVAHAEAVRLTEKRLIAIEQRAEARLALGDAADLVGDLEALVDLHPLRERFVELLMRALAMLGRQAEALAVYRDYRERLADETGLEPSPAIGDLERRILRGELAENMGMARASSDARAGSASGVLGLPAMTTSLVGRSEEIGDARAMLERHRIVTLTGTGGVGKTRIALEVAQALDRDEACEVAWIELASVADQEVVEHVIATTLGIDLGVAQQRRETLLEALSGRQLLLVLDNCEHLLATLAPLVDQVQRGCPRVRVLATSRERLAVDGEWVLPIGPLPIHEGDGEEAAEAVRLFCERATAVDSTLELSDQLPVVAEICRQLDGLPLAIELAAARTGVLSLDDLLAALQEGDRAAFGQRRSRPDRHHDLWAVTDWSYRLLNEQQQQLFGRLSVFAAAFGIDEAHAVCAPNGQRRAVTVEQLASLTERSLLTRQPDGARHGLSRYRLLRPLRAFARQRLADTGEAGMIARRHAAALTFGAEKAAGPPMTDEGRRWLEASLDDLREVRRRARLTSDLDVLARLVTALYWFDFWRLGAELLGWADDVLVLEGVEEHHLAPQIYAAAATAAWIRGDLQRARPLAARAVERCAEPDDRGRILAFEAVGDVAIFEGRLCDAEAAFQEIVRVARIRDDPDSEAIGLGSRGIVLAYAGRVSEARAEADAAGGAAVHAGPAAQAFARYAQGECRAETVIDEAVVLVQEAVELARACGARFTEGVAQLTSASLQGRHGDPTHAVPAYASLVQHWRRSGNWTQQWTTLRNLAELLVRVEADEPAVIIATAAEVEETAAPAFGKESDRLQQALATARTRLGDQRFVSARQQGRTMQARDVVELARATLDTLLKQ